MSVRVDQIAALAGETAELLGRADGAARYRELAEQVRAAFGTASTMPTPVSSPLTAGRGQLET
ncbi:hypothetical protein ACIBI9_19995 [Nonomuraea sp. NPDC050451]|uniref:hypothetical protein n=1 Tax=Nonomuraea sp. NPDC050451 TaxID=3364364 RepID=UPI003787E554